MLIKIHYIFPAIFFSPCCYIHCWGSTRPSTEQWVILLYVAYNPNAADDAGERAMIKLKRETDTHTHTKKRSNNELMMKISWNVSNSDDINHLDCCCCCCCFVLVFIFFISKNNFYIRFFFSFDKGTWINKKQKDTSTKTAPNNSIL